MLQIILFKKWIFFFLNVLHLILHCFPRTIVAEVGGRGRGGGVIETK